MSTESPLTACEYDMFFTRSHVSTYPSRESAMRRLGERSSAWTDLGRADFNQLLFCRAAYVAVTVSLWTSTPFTRMETVHTPGVDDSCLFQDQ